MTERSTARPGEPVNDDRLVGVPEVPPDSIELLAVVTVALYRLADGSESTRVAATNADTGGDLPTTTAIGILVLGLGDLTAPA